MSYLHFCLQFPSILVWRKGINVELKEWRSTWSPSKILTSSFLLNLHFFTFLGLERSTKVWKNLEVVKKSKRFFLFVFFFLLSLSLLFIYLLFKEWQLGLVSRNWLRPKRRKPRVAPSVVSCQRKRRATPLRKILWRHFLLPNRLPSALPLPPCHWRWLPLVERRLGRRRRLVISLFFPPFGMMLMWRLWRLIRCSLWMT